MRIGECPSGGLAPLRELRVRELCLLLAHRRERQTWKIAHHGRPSCILQFGALRCLHRSYDELLGPGLEPEASKSWDLPSELVVQRFTVFRRASGNYCL